MKSKITTSAPGKLMLFGEHAVIYGRPCIVTAVDQRIYATVEKIAGEKIVINAPQLEVKNFSIDISRLGKAAYPKEVKFVLKAVENFFKKYKVSTGLRITTKSEFSSMFGFGSSSAVTVCVIKSLAKIFDIEVDNKALFDIAYKTVLDIQGVGSGFDLAAAIWGGTLYFVTGGQSIRPLNTGRLPLVVGYTGIKADTATLIKKVGELQKKYKKEIGGVFNLIGEIVNEAKSALVKGNYKKAGLLANINQCLLEGLGVNTQRLTDLIMAARAGGAYGAKLSGAGGGDCMISFVPASKLPKVKNGIKKAGGVVLDIKFNAEGVRIEK